MLTPRHANSHLNSRPMTVHNTTLGADDSR